MVLCHYTDQFVKKLMEVSNVPSVEWLHTTYMTGTRGSKWLLQTLIDIKRLPKEAPNLLVSSPTAEESLAVLAQVGTDMATCAKYPYQVWVREIMKPLQDRILKVL